MELEFSAPISYSCMRIVNDTYKPTYASNTTSWYSGAKEKIIVVLKLENHTASSYILSNTQSNYNKR